MRTMFAAAICCLIAAPVWAEECEDAVDLADSLEFHKMHVECDDDPVVIYDSNSKTSFFSRKEKAVNTYDKTSEVEPLPARPAKTAAVAKVTEQNLAAPQRLVPASASTAPVPQAETNAGVVFNAREPFTLTGGPQSALNGLYAQMVHYCPQGWEKLKEWAEPNAGGYFLHYQFQCSE